MKVHLYGNTLNNSYNLALFLRAKGIDAEMFLDDSSKLQQDYPWWEDAGLNEGNLPDWIHYYKVNPNFLFPQNELKRMIIDFSVCDIALVCGWGPIIAQRAKVPYFFYSFGSDLVITALRENLFEAIRKSVYFKKPRGLRSLLFFGPIQRKAICNADRIGITMGYQVNTYVRKLGLTDKMRKVRLAWDIEKYAAKRNLFLKEKYKRFDVIYFMIARHSWRSVWNDPKGNDKFFRAYARLVKEKKPNALLVTIQKGHDVEASMRLISELNIESYVEWVKEMNKDGIRGYISLDNVVVVDQFWHDKWYLKYPEDKEKPRMPFGSGSIEALSAGKPLITAFSDEDFYENEFPPILSAFTEDEIYKRLIESLEMGDSGRKELGRRGYEYVKKYNGWENTIDLYINVLNEILDEKKNGEKPGSPLNVERTSQIPS
ncbi:MAG: glycosyltransferase [Bacteroidetes bacterium]|nr:glycosyltransferase [Bacteroidota bacterium]